MCKFIVCNNEILDNLKEVKNNVNKNTLICAVVKADAYGFGLSKMCKLLSSRVDYFAVARLSEFLKYKELKIEKPCLILSPLQETEIAIAVKRGAEVTIDSFESLEYLIQVCNKNNIKAKVHLKIDTGMNRFGIKSVEKLQKILQKIKENAVIELVGCYSHLFCAEKTQNNKKQNEIFKRYKEIVLSYGFCPVFHMSNSLGLNDKSLTYDMVRVGYSLYTKKQNSEHKFVCEVALVKKVFKGETVGYSKTFKAKKDMIIAVCNAGYADGVKRALSNKGKVIIKNQFCDIVGSVCMDSFAVDVTKLDKVKKGDEVILFGKVKEMSISVCDLAKIC
ncbi:MAG: alanine racemase, partial [Clostridia bacterium]|nr:alanine racemase [Clostridia bacterium]